MWYRVVPGQNYAHFVVQMNCCAAFNVSINTAQDFLRLRLSMAGFYCLLNSILANCCNILVHLSEPVYHFITGNIITTSKKIMEKNLNSKEAVEKLQALINQTGTCMFFTKVQSGVYNTRPMVIIEVDINGTCWFFTNKHSEMASDIEKDSHVHLVFSNPIKESYLDLRGRASIEHDRKSIEEKWKPIVKPWFPEGTNDPDLCLIKVKTDEAHYWDNNNTKMVEILKTVASIVTGNQPVLGVHGDLLV
jgi:general stress protein 26